MEKQDDTSNLKNQITFDDSLNMKKLLETKFEDPENVIPNSLLAKRFNIPERKVAKFLKENGYVWDRSTRTYWKEDGDITQRKLREKSADKEKIFVLLDKIKISEEAYVLLMLMTNGNEDKMNSFISKAILKAVDRGMKKRFQHIKLIDLKNKFRLAEVFRDKKGRIKMFS